jgi:hypothetical protein
MATQTITTSDLGANLLTDVWVEKQFISRLLDTLLAVRLGKPSSLPEHMGKVVRWQFSSQPTVLSAVTDGADPTARNFTTTTATATLGEFKAETVATRQLLKVGLSAWLEEVVDAAGFQMAETFDTVALTSLDGTTVSVDAGVAMTAEITRQAVQKLVMVNAKPHPASPGGKFYYGLYSGEAAYDMMGEGQAAWFQVKRDEYLNTLVSPFGDDVASAAVYGAIIKISNNVRRLAGSPDDDLNVIVANEALGVASLDTNVIEPRVYVTRPNERVDRGSRDLGSVGTYALFAAQLLDANRCVKVSSDATGT